MPSLSDTLDRINWHCMFPITIAGVRTDSYENEDDAQITTVLQETLDSASVSNPNNSSSDDIFCKCDSAGVLSDMSIGIRVEFFEPTRVFEVVKDAWCFPMLGQDSRESVAEDDDNTVSQTKNGTTDAVDDETMQRQIWQVHYYVFPVLGLLEIMMDFICMDFSSFDLGYMTEPDPRWLDSELALVLAPEAVLFANPLAQLSCIPEVMSATVGYVIDPLYWCQGSWGKALPPSGHITHAGQPMQSVGTAMGRAMFLLHRSFVMWGTAGDEALCHRYPQPIWKKSQYKWQLLNPVRDPKCRVIGEPGFKWTSAKNPPFPNKNPDNFSILVWRKRTCCAR